MSKSRMSKKTEKKQQDLQKNQLTSLVRITGKNLQTPVSTAA